MDKEKVATIVQYILWAALFAFAMYRGLTYGHWKTMVLLAGLFIIFVSKNIWSYINERKMAKENEELPDDTFIPDKELVDAMVRKSNAISDEINRLCPPQPCLRFSIDHSRKPSVIDSKLGGTPYWDASKPYPTDSKGKPMAMVFQVNFEQCPPLEPLPKTGMLQFFISSDDEILLKGYGVNYNDYTLQSDFRLVYHGHISTYVDKLQLESYPRVETLEYSPVAREYALNMQLGTSCINQTCRNFNDLAATAIKNLYDDKMDAPDVSDYVKRLLPEEQRDKVPDDIVLGNNPIYQCVSEKDFQMLGYPNFEQCDEYEEYSAHDILLLQIPTIDAEENAENDSRFCTIWGDCGSARLFINSDALLRLDFDNVLYDYQCY